MAEEENQNLVDSNALELRQPAWFTPKRLLIILCWINLLNFLDRGAISSNGINGLRGNPSCLEEGPCSQGTGIMGDFSLSYFQDGILSSAYLVGLLIASPICAELSKTINPLRLIGVGLGIWTVAIAGCGFSVGFWSITSFRTLMGVAEASFNSLAALFIDDYAPEGKLTAWLSIFFSCIPLGLALGYVYGGVVGGIWGWRVAFWGLSLLMLPFAIFGLFSEPVHLKGLQPSPNHSTALLKDSNGGPGPGAGAGAGAPLNASEKKDQGNPGQYLAVIGRPGTGLVHDIKRLMVQKVYVINLLGFVAWSFVIGAYAYWGARIGEELFDIENVDLIFGGVTVLSGTIGTLGGGYFMDYVGSTIPKAYKFLAIVTGCGSVSPFFAFSATSIYWFILFFAMGQISGFATLGPVNFITLHSVATDLRPMAVAVSLVAGHVFGDVPSPPIVGVFQDAVGNWRLTAQLLAIFLLIAAALWAFGAFLRPEDLTDREYEPIPPQDLEGEEGESAGP